MSISVTSAPDGRKRFTVRSIVLVGLLTAFAMPLARLYDKTSKSVSSSSTSIGASKDVSHIEALSVVG